MGNVSLAMATLLGQFPIHIITLKTFLSLLTLMGKSIFNIKY